jgi:hypothetical protein
MDVRASDWTQSWKGDARMQIRKKKSLLEQAGEYVDAVRPHVEQAAQTAKDRAVPLLQEARDRAMPVIADGAALAADKAAVVAEVASTKAQEGAAVAAEKASAGRDLATTKVAELRGETPKKKHRLRKFLLFTGLAAGAAFVAKKLKGDDQSANWQSYKPAPAAKPATPPAAATAPKPDPTAPKTEADPAGSSPDEALADAAEETETRSTSTPDAPAEEVVTDEGAGSHKK